MARNVVIDIKAKTSQYERAVKGATRATGGLDSKLGMIAKKGAALGAGAAIAGVAALGAAVVKVGIDSAKAFANFERSLSQIEGLVGIAHESVMGFKDGIKELSVESGRGPQELADALFFITSAGLEGAEAMDALEVSAKAATAGLGDTANIADVVTSAMNAYGSDVLSAAQSTDVLVATVREGKAAAPELAGSLGQVIPIASAMGVSFDEVGASIAAMTRTGLNAAEASTALKSILNSILAPTSDAAKALDELGLSSASLKAEIRDRGLFQTLQGLTEAFDGNDEATTRVFGNVRALTGIMSLMGSNAEATEAIFDSLAESTGAMDVAFDAAADTGAFAFEQAKARIEVALLDVGEEILPKLADAMDDIAPHLADLVGGIGDLSIAFVDFGVAAVPAFIDGMTHAEKAVINLQIAGLKLQSAWGDVTDVADVALGPWINMGDAFDETKESQLKWLETQRMVIEGLYLGNDATRIAVEALAGLGAEGALTAERVAALQDRLGLTGPEMAHAAEIANQYAGSLGASKAELILMSVAFAPLLAGLEDERQARVIASKTANAQAEAEYYAARAAGENADVLAGDLGPALSDYQQTLEDTLAAQESLADAMKAAADPTFKAVKAVEKLGKAEADLAEIQADEKATAEEVAAAQLAVVEATLEAQGALDGVDGQAMEAALDAIATALGLSDDEARELLTTLGILDGTEVTTVITVRTEEQRIIQEERHQALADKLRASGEDIPEFALGGRVPGSGPQLAVVHGGEEILTPRESRMREGSFSTNQGAGGVTVIIERPETQDLQGDVTAGLTMAGVVQQVDVIGGF